MGADSVESTESIDQRIAETRERLALSVQELRHELTPATQIERVRSKLTDRLHTLVFDDHGSVRPQAIVGASVALALVVAGIAIRAAK